MVAENMVSQTRGLQPDNPPMGGLAMMKVRVLVELTSPPLQSTTMVAEVTQGPLNGQGVGQELVPPLMIPAGEDCPQAIEGIIPVSTIANSRQARTISNE